MVSDEELTRLHAASVYALELLERTPRPLFATPAVAFDLARCGGLAQRSVAYLSRKAALHEPPSRALSPALPASSGGRAICFALDAEGDLHALADARPAHLLIYLRLPATTGCLRRLLRIQPQRGVACVLADRLLPFDRCFFPPLTSPSGASEQPHFTSTVH